MAVNYLRSTKSKIRECLEKGIFGYYKGALEKCPFIIFLNQDAHRRLSSEAEMSLWVQDGRMDHDRGMNQDAKDERIDHDYNQMSLEIPRYCRGVPNTPAPFKHDLISISD